MNKKLNISYNSNGHGKVTCSAPSNIALVKYWGKKGPQFPANPSVSMTLRQSVTHMEMEYHGAQAGSGISLDFFFEGARNDGFKKKIHDYLLSLPDEFSFLNGVRLVIHSRNTFPHSAGIASSASSMAALALCLLSLKQKILGKQEPDHEFSRQASDLARQASGSACRSVYPGYALWGEHPAVPGSSDRYAIPVPGPVHPVFRDIRDAILLVSSSSKAVSSRAGHGLMTNHPLAEARYQMAFNNTREIINAMQTGDMDAFIRITEQEALTLHGMMMSSREPFLLLHPNSLHIIQQVARFRNESKIPVCFTIDAGPNIHLLYPGENENKVKDWINDDLSGYLENNQWIDDSMGPGPVINIE